MLVFVPLVSEFLRIALDFLRASANRFDFDLEFLRRTW